MKNYEWRDSADGTASELWAELYGQYSVVAYIRKDSYSDDIWHYLISHDLNTSGNVLYGHSTLQSMKQHVISKIRHELERKIAYCEDLRKIVAD
ncbi:hypothetical protein [Eisenbergiella tayi]|uniref:hypothetical protein n=1 Tax=Eisenbergiella tayi TaxID=1432052 RepID=UPI00307C5328